MKCINNVNSCVRKNNHQSISLEEFLDNYFNIYLNELHTSTDTSQRVNTLEHFCKNCQEIYDNFNQENEKIGSEMIQIFQSFIDKINNLFVKFNQDFISYIKMKQDE
jgi:protein-arginine kinase activator protein McsA